MRGGDRDADRQDRRRGGARSGELRAAIVAAGASPIGCGVQPREASGDAGITPKSRYRRIRDLLGDAAATPVAGMHVHVGMPDPETAIRAYNGLRRHLPLLQALAANSPFRDDRDAGVHPPACSRCAPGCAPASRARCATSTSGWR